MADFERGGNKDFDFRFMKTNCWLILGMVLATTAVAQVNTNKLPAIPAPVIATPPRAAPAPMVMPAPTHDQRTGEEDRPGQKEDRQEGQIRRQGQRRRKPPKSRP